MIYINITNFALISELEKDHCMIETCCLKNVIIFIQTILSFVLSREINVSVIVKHVQHIRIVRAFCLPWGTFSVF